MTPQLLYYNIGDDVKAFSTTRHGGCSSGSYAELNVNRYCGDSPDDISRNRQLLCQELDIEEAHLVMPHQVHGTEVRLITKEFLSLSINEQQQQLEGVDAVMTCEKGVCVSVSTADCIPILLYDAAHDACCAVHSGWRGTVKRITRKAVATMMTTFGTQTSQLKAVIGPGISLKNFEVGDEVYRQFQDASFNMERISKRYPSKDGGERWHIDLPEANRLQLLAAGVPQENIQLSGVCTYDQSADYFSARKLGVNSGRILSGLVRTFCLAFALIFARPMLAQQQFTPLEQQKISIETPGLFDQSNAFTIDFAILHSSDYSFPLPLGKAEKRADYNVEITTSKGDAVKAMFDGVVRMSWDHPKFGKVVILRHDNGLETVYGGNAENRVRVGDKVEAGQTIAIVGGKDGRTFCEFAVMVNGARINPEMILDLKSHQLLQKTILCRLDGFKVKVGTIESDPWDSRARNKKETEAELKKKYDPFAGGSKFTIDLSAISEKEWHYPLPGAKVISPFGRRDGRNHSGTDLKTKPNDDILAAFDGVVTMSQRYAAYGNCVILRHANGLETLYSHNVKNLVKVGDHVKAGQKIALTGRTGRATTEHLHFEVRVGGRAYNSTMIFDHNTHQLKKGKVTFHKK